MVVSSSGNKSHFRFRSWAMEEQTWLRQAGGDGLACCCWVHICTAQLCCGGQGARAIQRRTEGLFCCPDRTPLDYRHVNPGLSGQRAVKMPTRGRARTEQVKQRQSWLV